ncbi:MAG TPA: hypothetical protein VHX37_13545 [Acidobacteriaceae bacterium]|jgi:hypothetical protein|nr:hypothetical protein [Acidobacteriaceae bacterium]
MSEHVILNPLKGYDPQIGDAMNPDYGFSRKRTATRALMKAVGGIPYTREQGNTGHTLVLSWLGRTWGCVRRLKWFYEQFEDGYFTLIDHDGGGRHYVGRFTSEVQPIESNNNKWDVQNVQFEEIPQCPMLQYPNDWVNDAIDLYVCNDFRLAATPLGEQKLATQGAWTLAQQKFGEIPRTIATDNGTIGDWAQYEYRGYGFQLSMMVGAGQGIAQVFVDGTLAATIGLGSSSPVLAPKMVFEQANLPLDLHRVQVTVQAAEFTPTAGGASTPIQTWAAGVAPAGWAQPGTPSGYAPAGLPVAWYALKVMR